MTEHYYTPGRIGYWLSRWHELELLAARAPGSPTPSLTPRSPGGYRPSDPLRYCDIEADITRAWVSLGYLSLEYRCVGAVMQGFILREVERTFRLRHGAAVDAYQRALKRMAQYLGWTGGDQQPLDTGTEMRQT
jgi:hypothetical protein